MKIVKVTRYGREELGILFDGLVMNEHGDVCKEEQAETIKGTRNVPAGVRAEFEKQVKLFKENSKVRKQIEGLEKLSREFRNERAKMFENIQVARGLLSSADFIKEFKANLPQRILSEIDRYGYTIECGGRGTAGLEIVRCVDIQKWFRGSFVAQEYDGTSYIYSRDNAEYKRILSNNSRPLSIRRKFTEEWLELGDKNWLSYWGRYSIPVNRSDFTKETAKKLATEFGK